MCKPIKVIYKCIHLHFFSKSDAKLRKNSLSCNSYGDNWVLFGSIRIGKKGSE